MAIARYRLRSFKGASGARAFLHKGRRKAFAYGLSNSMAKLIKKRLPSGMKVTLVVEGRKADERLKSAKRSEWPVPVEMTTRSKTTLEASAYTLSPRAKALLRGKDIAEADLREAGGAYNLEQVMILLNGITRQALEKRVKQGSLLTVPGPSNRRRYPAAQFSSDGVVAGLREVQKTLPTQNPWAVLNFLVRPDDRLGGRKPIEILREGGVDIVVSAARSMGFQGG